MFYKRERNYCGAVVKGRGVSEDQFEAQETTTTT